MTLSVHGVHCDLGEALKTHVTEKLQSLDEKFFSRGLDATVTFSKTETKGFRANIVAHVGHKTYQADSAGKGAHQALDAAANLLAKQLRREKQRVRDSHHGAKLKARMDELITERAEAALA